MLKRKPHFALLLLTLSSFFLQGAASLSAPNTWIPAPAAMNTGRSNACSVLLRDGSTLVAGGTGQAGALSSAELFGADNRFHAVPSMMNARSSHACALLPDGTVLVAGGRTSGDGITNAVEIFDPESMTWSPGPSMLEARAGATVSVLRDGRVLIAGGDVSAGPSSSLEIYSAAAGGFHHVDAALSSARREHAAAVLADGRVLLVGGSDGSKVLDTADLFDPATERVTPAGKLQLARSGFTATTLLNGRVLIAGGSDGRNEIGAAEVFYPKTGEFRLDPSLMISPRRDHTAIRIPGNNTVVIAGGTFQGRPLAQTEIYIPWRHRFQGAGDLSSARTAMTAGGLRRAGKLLVAGGRNSAGVQSNAEIISVPTIATDKGDYHPGEPVTFTGSGWLPNKPVRIVMTEDSDLDRPDPIVTMADADGNITDSSFAPDLLDIGVKFYVTATQDGPADANGQPTVLTAQTTFTDAANLKFTDGTGGVCASGPNQYQSSGAAAAFGQKVCATATGLGAGSSTVTVNWVQPNTTVVFTSSVALSNGNFQDIEAPNAQGQWTLNVYTDNTLTTLLGTGTFFVGPFSGRLQFITGPFSLQTNTCSAANTIQLQDSLNAPFTGLTFPTTVSLTSSAPATTSFFSDASCVTGISSVTIPANSSNTPSFYFKSTAAGSVTLTGSAAGVTNNATQIETFAGTATHYTVSAPGSATAGTAFSFTVTALDASNSTATGYTGTVHFTSTDGQAVLPANTTLVNGVGTFSATLKTSGNQTITATDTVTGSITGTSGSIAVAAGAATHYTVTAPGSATANSAISVTVTALDQFNNTATGYAGTVHFTSSDAQAALPANGTLTNGVGTFSVTLKTAGSQTITATDTVTGSITGTSGSIGVTAGAATHYTVSAPASATAGTAFSITVTALDQFNNTATAYAGTVHFTSADGQAVLPANSTLTNGVGTFSATLKTAGNQTITATDTVTGSITGTSGAIAVSAAAATHYTVSAPGSATANIAFSLTVTAQDQFNNTATGYAGTVHFTSSDGAAVLPANSTLVNGVGTFSATLKTAGSQTITATDTVSGSITGTSATVTVSAGAATHFTVSAPGSATAGTSFSFTVTAQDASNLTATGYTGTVHFTSTDGQAVLPANATLVNGVGTFSATLKTAGSQTITATDTVTGSITGTSAAITVSAAAATHYTVTAPASATANSAFSFTVTAQDQFNNTATAYAGTVHFTSTDGQAVLPANSTLTNGVGTFSATLKTAGSQTVTATDTVTGSITGTSGAISVAAGAATHYTVTAPGSATAGTAFSFTVTALDQFNNTATGYAGTVHFTSSDGQAVLPANSTLTNGVGTFSATLKTGGNQTVTATDTVTGSITGTSGTIAVSAAAATHYTVSASGSATAGTAFSFTVTALDQFNNTATGYAGTVHFASSDGQAVLPANSTLTNGVGTFSATLKTAGNQSITATDTVTGSITGTSGAIAVSAGAASHYTVSAPGSATANSPFSFTVTALDAFNNTATGYSGTVHFTSTDGAAVLPANSTLVNGVGTFSATLKTPANQTISATDTVSGSVTGTSAAIAVSAGAATHFTVSAPGSATAGTAFNFTVTALDASNLTATGYTGTVHFTSTDGAAVLPANATLVNGVGTFSATLKTAGSQTVTATDTVTGSINGTSGAIAVSAATASHYTVSAPGSATANSSFVLTVTAFDQFNNTATGYAGTVHFTSTDGAAVLPANSTLVNGVGTFTATLKTPGSQTITATDTVSGSITGTSAAISVSAGAATHFTVSAPGSATAGTGFNFTVTALDASNLTATAYSGTVHFTSTDGAGVLPANATLVNGVGTFSATLKTAGSQTVTATDTVTGSINGTSGAIAVAGGAATHYTVSGPGSSTANSAVSVTVTALDAFNNTATGYSGTVHFTSTDGAAVLPANSTLINGVGTFSATLKTPGSQTITATDTVSGSITGTSAAISVSAGAATHFTVSAPASATAGTSFNFTVTALDASNLTASSYTGTVHFTSTDGQAVLPANATLVNGVGTFSATLKTSGAKTISATDTVTGSITGTSGAISVASGAATHFVVSGPAQNASGAALTLTVTAVDAFGNTVTNYTGTVHFTSSDSQATLPANYTFTAGDNGVHTFNATLQTSGSQSITASDGVSSGSLAVTIGGGSSSVTLTASSTSLTAGQIVAFTATVTPSSATGFVTFQEGGTILGSAPVSSGIASFSLATLNPGTHTITATYTGSASFGSSTSGPVTLTVAAADNGNVSLNVSVSENPATLGKPVTVTVAIVTSGGTPASGNVQFFDGSVLIGTAPVVNGQASTSITLTGGQHNLSVTYVGNLPTASKTYGLSITKSAGALSLTTASPATTAGQPVTLTARISGQAPAGMPGPAGDVQFFDGSVLIGTSSLVNGVATLTVSNLAAGNHQITAIYAGDSNWNAVTAGAVVQVVTAIPSATGLRFVSTNDGVNLVAKVANSTGGVNPTGSVNFIDAASKAVIATAILSGGEASAGIKPGQVKAGMKLLAVYAGDSLNAASTSDALVIDTALNAASYAPGALAPDAIASVFPTGFAVSGQPKVETTSVRITDSAGMNYSAVVFFVSPKQINFVVPPAVVAGSALVTVVGADGSVSIGAFDVAQVAPGMFSANSTGQGVASAWLMRAFADGSVSPRQNVAVPGSGDTTYVPATLTLNPGTDKAYLELYVTGIRHSSSLTLTIDGKVVPILFGGPHSQFVGLDQINAEIPDGLKGAGEVKLTLTADGQTSNAVTLVIN